MSYDHGHFDLDLFGAPFVVQSTFKYVGCDVKSSRTWYEHAGETISVSDTEDIFKGTEVQP